MLIELLVATALAGPLDADRFSVGVPLETDLVGLAFGARPEVSWQPTGPDSALQLRAATGVMVGPELVFVPLSASVRGRFFPRGRVHPIVGAGAELQTFLMSGHPVVVRPSYVFEVGLDVTVRGPWSVGVVVETGFAPPPSFGFGAAVRGGVTRQL